MYIVGLSGKSGHGKDYIAKIMQDLWGYYPLPLSLQVKIDAISKFGATYEEVFITKPPHIRELLQKIGTDNGRDFYGKDMWINATYAFAQWANDVWGINKFVLPDIRFANELQFLKQTENFVIRIIADEKIRTKFGLKGPAAHHSSEIELDNTPFDQFDGIIYNQFDNREDVQDQLEVILTNLTKVKL